MPRRQSHDRMLIGRKTASNTCAIAAPASLLGPDRVLTLYALAANADVVPAQSARTDYAVTNIVAYGGGTATAPLGFAEEYREHALRQAFVAPRMAATS